MRTKLVGLILILGLLLPVLVLLPKPVQAINSGVSSLYNAEVAREELVASLDTTAMPTAALPQVTPFWVDMVDAEGLSSDGEGVYVAVLDTGLLGDWQYFFSEANIADHLGKGFSHNVWWNPAIGDFVWEDVDDTRGFITDPYMGSGHGTHVTSTIVGYNFFDAMWIQGVAPKATIIPVLVLDAWMVPYPGGWAQFRGGTDEMVSEGIYYVADLAESLDGPVIISMSLGGPDPSDMIEDAIDYAISKGVIIVASAGNEGEAGMGWPGAFPQVISTGMAGWTEQWNFGSWWRGDVPENLNTPDSWGNNWQLFLDYGSSRPNKDLGQKSFHLDLTAPGCAIVGPYKPYFSWAMGYYYLWGTSMAAPHVSGIASLVLQSHPDMTQAQMEHVLKIAAAGLPLPSDGSLAWDVPGVLYYFTWDGTDYGKGLLQADAALKAAK
jgi:subtilisin family serine protease